MMSRPVVLFIIVLTLVLMPASASAASANDCPAWYTTACWARTLQGMIDAIKDLPDATRQYCDRTLASAYQAGLSLGEVAGTAGSVLGQAYGALAEHHDKVCADDDLFFMEGVGVIAAGIFAVEVTMTGGLSGGAGAVALKGLLVAQSPKLMSKLHERLCGTPFTKADAGLVTQVETAIEKAVSGK